jgi:hypothetical protein
MTTTITVSDVINQVRLLANQNPDFVYRPSYERTGHEGCSYVTGSEGKGCIVGQALANLGVERSVLASVEGEHAVGALVAVGIVRSEDPHHASRGDAWSPEEKWLMAVQRQQDDSKPWSEAVARADQMHDALGLAVVS